jgi:hypothetical protein
MRSNVFKAIAAVVLIGASFSMVACDNDADIVNENLNKDADNFKVNRRSIL